MTIKKYIPNTFTMANIMCGCLATLFAINNQLDWAAGFVVVGVFFDFFDGFFARLFKVQSELGLQLDSLADMITSGLVPGIIMYKLLGEAVGTPWGDTLSHAYFYVPYLGFAITLASAYRLAKFNIDTEQSNSFIGLPTPANTLLILSIPLILLYEEYAFAEALFTNTYVLLGITAISCWLLNARIPLFALKFKTWNVADNKVRYIFLILTVFSLAIFHYLGVMISIVGYVVLSLLFREKQK